MDCIQEPGGGDSFILMRGGMIRSARGVSQYAGTLFSSDKALTRLG